MNAYVMTMSMRLKMLLQYRAAAIAGAGTQIFFGLVRVMIFDAFYASGAGTQPMSSAQTTTYLWLGQAFLVIAMLGVDGELAGLIRSGNIAYEMTRPVDLHTYWFARMVAGRAGPAILRCGPILIFAALLGQLSPPASVAHGVLFVVALTMGLVLASAFFEIVTISILWTVSGEGISRLAPPLVFFLSGMIIPLPLFPEWCQPVISAMPFRGLMDVPFRIYLGHLSWSETWAGFGQQAVWIGVFIIIGRMLLKRGLSRLVVQGG